MDVVTPKIDGFDLFGKIRSIPELEGTPESVVTAGAVRDLEERSRAAGGGACFCRPYDSGELIKKLNKLIKDKVS